MAEQSKVQEYLELDSSVAITRLTYYVTPSGGFVSMHMQGVINMAPAPRVYCYNYTTFPKSNS